VWRKQTLPVDRCVAELDERMIAVRRQIRALEGQTSTSTGEGNAPAQSEISFTKKVLSILDEIPDQSPQKSRALSDEIADPLKDLGTGAQFYGSGKQPELFSVSPQSPVAEPAKPATRESKLARYLKAVSFESSVPLRRVQRETRNKFWLWLGLGLLVVLFICIVVR
ncbi:MAG: hypothetical protein ABSC38_07530, partial [Verrucomicrobiia bacterium]